MIRRGYVLAGGASTRMGADKARVPLNGWPTAVRLCERIEAAGLEAALIRREPDGLPWRYPDGRPVRVVREPGGGGRHPLRGVRTALLDAGEPALVIPCDLPRLGVGSLRRLVGAGIGVAAGHPLVGVFPLELERLQRHIDRGCSVRAYVEALPRVGLPEEELYDRNRLTEPWPFALLLRRLRGCRGLDRERALRGEVRRLAARGVVLPRELLYAPGVDGEEP